MTRKLILKKVKGKDDIFIKLSILLFIKKFWSEFTEYHIILLSLFL